MLLTAYAYGAVFTVMPDFGEHVGIRNKGLLFTFLTVASLSVRLVAGRASDYYGRRTVLLVASGMVAVSMILLGLGSTPRDLIIAVTLYGLAQGMTSPTLFAWATDLSDENHKGRGISTLYIFMEMGIGIGAFASGLVFGNDPANFFVTFLICAMLAFVAFVYLIFLHRIPAGLPRDQAVLPADESISSDLDQI
jgi:MFS family permease